MIVAGSMIGSGIFIVPAEIARQVGSAGWLIAVWVVTYVAFAVLIFYILTIAGVLILRRKRPEAERPYRAFGYPVVPIAYIAVALLIVIVLLLYLTSTTWPGLLIVLTGIPVYLVWRRKERGLTTAVPENE
jgi:amino acid transporter